MHVYFVRHGESASNRVHGHTKNSEPREKNGEKDLDTPLTELGKTQAAVTAVYLKSKLGDKMVVLTSHLSRAEETARAIGNYNFLSSSKEWVPATETKDQVTGRIKEALEELETMSVCTIPIVVVGHSLFLSSLLAYLISGGQPLGEITIELPNCSITSAEFTPKSDKWPHRAHWAVYEVGKTDHLGACATAVHAIGGRCI